MRPLTMAVAPHDPASAELSSLTIASLALEELSVGEKASVCLGLLGFAADSIL
jgi:hypothetical protein